MMPILKKGSKAHICLQCASVFSIKHRSSRNDGKYCSRECRFEYLKWRTKTRATQQDGDKWKAGGKQCLTCAIAFLPPQPKTKFCSLKCSIKHHNPPVPIREMECRQCGETYQGKGQPVCKECVRLNMIEARRSTKNIKDRCKKYGTIYTPGINRDSIFRRDDWVCQLCGIQCRRDGNYLADDAPELDHIIPISKGGNHEESNLMCLCRKCNAEKSDMILA